MARSAASTVIVQFIMKESKRLMINFVQYPAETAIVSPPLIIAHGLFGSARNWGVTARRLATRRNVVAVDMRNHGESDWHPVQSYTAMAEDLAEVILGLGGPADVLGHSMGGKAAMVLALMRPDLVSRLVVADIAPVAYAHDNTRHVQAMRSLDLTDVKTRTEADQRLALTVPDAGLRAFFLQSLDLRAAPPRWRLNLDVLDASMAQIVGWPDISGSYPGPVLFLTGGKSSYVLPEHRDVIVGYFPKARFARLSQAGHWLHADAPRAFEETVEVFLSTGRMLVIPPESKGLHK
jgi:pimeloyl-ACP methyl ester carboxylesterase